MADVVQSAFLRVPVECLPTVIGALKTAGFDQVARDVESFTRDYTDEAANEVRKEWLARAGATVAKEGEIEFDSDATISHSDANGQYVLAWVWVDGDEEEAETNG